MGLVVRLVFSLSMFHVGNTRPSRSVCCDDIKVPGGFKFDYPLCDGKIRAHWDPEISIAELDDGRLKMTDAVVSMTDSYVITTECKWLLMEFKKVNERMSEMEYIINCTQGSAPNETRGSTEVSWPLIIRIGIGIGVGLVLILLVVLVVLAHYRWWKKGGSGRDFTGYIDSRRTWCLRLCAGRERERMERPDDGGPGERDPALGV